MELHFATEMEVRFEPVAVSHGKDAEQLLQDTVVRMLDDQASFIGGVQRGIEQAERGEFVNHRDVLHRIEKML
jgi:predicted transcriptional regulator